MRGLLCAKEESEIQVKASKYVEVGESAMMFRKWVKNVATTKLE